MSPQVSVWLWIPIDLALLDPDPELFCEMTNNSHPRLSKKKHYLPRYTLDPLAY